MLSQLLATNDVWFIEPGFLQSFLEMASSRDLSFDEAKMGSLFDLINNANTYERKDDIAIISVSGSLIKKANPILQFLLGVSSYETIESNFRKALQDDQVKAIMMRYDTPGGLVSGLSSLSNLIYGSRKVKPIMAYVENATSAGYWLASSASSVILGEVTSKVGSIGCVAIHRSIKNAAEKLGIEFTVIASGAFKKLGNEYEQLSEKDREYFQGRIEHYHDLFLDAVSRNLGKPVDQLPENVKESQVFIGQEGITNGLASEILSFDQAMAKLKSMIGSNRRTTSAKYQPSANATRKGNQMSFKNIGLKEILSKIQETQDVDELAVLEQGLVAECQRRKASAKNWVEENEAESLKTNVTSLVSQRRRQILAMPKIAKNKAELELGQAIGRSYGGKI